MNCWHCERPAHGACNFCGRGICKEHIKTMPAIISLFRDKEQKMKAIAVKDALYCGVCQPVEHPVLMEELDGNKA